MSDLQSEDYYKYLHHPKEGLRLWPVPFRDGRPWHQDVVQREGWRGRAFNYERGQAVVSHYPDRSEIEIYPFDAWNGTDGASPAGIAGLTRAKEMALEELKKLHPEALGPGEYTGEDNSGWDKWSSNWPNEKPMEQYDRYTPRGWSWMQDRIPFVIQGGEPMLGRYNEYHSEIPGFLGYNYNARGAIMSNGIFDTPTGHNKMTVWERDPDLTSQEIYDKVVGALKNHPQYDGNPVVYDELEEDGWEGEHWASSVHSVSDWRKKENYKDSSGGKACGNCAAFENGYCRMFKSFVSSKKVCDEWVTKSEWMKEGAAQIAYQELPPYGDGDATLAMYEDGREVASITYDLQDMPDALYIEALWVQPEDRRKGYATQLVNELMRRQGVTKEQLAGDFDNPNWPEGGGFWKDFGTHTSGWEDWGDEDWQRIEEGRQQIHGTSWPFYMHKPDGQIYGSKIPGAYHIEVARDNGHTADDIAMAPIHGRLCHEKQWYDQYGDGSPRVHLHWNRTQMDEDEIEQRVREYFGFQNPRLSAMSASKWAYLNGQVMFHDHPHHALYTMALDQGLGDTKAKQISNYIAAGRHPTGLGHRVAIGSMYEGKPLIWMSTADRNHVWDTVAGALDER